MSPPSELSTPPAVERVGEEIGAGCSGGWVGGWAEDGVRMCRVPINCFFISECVCKCHVIALAPHKDSCHSTDTSLLINIAVDNFITRDS